MIFKNVNQVQAMDIDKSLNMHTYNHLHKSMYLDIVPLNHLWKGTTSLYRDVRK